MPHHILPPVGRRVPAPIHGSSTGTPVEVEPIEVSVFHGLQFGVLAVLECLQSASVAGEVGQVPAVAGSSVRDGVIASGAREVDTVVADREVDRLDQVFVCRVDVCGDGDGAGGAHCTLNVGGNCCSWVLRAELVVKGMATGNYRSPMLDCRLRRARLSFSQPHRPAHIEFYVPVELRLILAARARWEVSPSDGVHEPLVGAVLIG